MRRESREHKQTSSDRLASAAGIAEARHLYIVTLRARIHALHDEYTRVAPCMRELALRELGCIHFHAVTEGQDEGALSW